MDFSLFSVQSINNFFVHNPIFTVSIGLSAVIATLIYLFGFSHNAKTYFKRRAMKAKIDNMKDHFIVCGLGRVGLQIAKELAEEKVDFVILEREESKLAFAKEKNWPFLIGDVAVDESSFQQANIEQAKGIIIAVGTDADAIFMAISARALKKDIFIIARASSTEAADKMTKIGVNRIAMPYQIGGYHMATMAMRPGVMDFLDVLVDQEKDELEMEEFVIYEDGEYIGKTLNESELIKDGLAVLALRRKNGKAVINPSGSVKLEVGDRLVVMGSEKDLAALGKLIIKHQPKEQKLEEVEAKKMMADVKPSPSQEEKKT